MKLLSTPPTAPPWVTALTAFLLTASLASATVPAILYDIPRFWQAVIIAGCGLVTVPVGALLGGALRDWLAGRG
jgi:hypothetical protein